MSAVISRVLFSGNANNGAFAGLGYSNTNNTPTNANANIGTQLSYKNVGDGALPLGKKSRVQQGVGSGIREDSEMNSRT